MDTTSETQHLRDEFHALEIQAGGLEKELRDREQELEDEKRNSEIVRHVITVNFICIQTHCPCVTLCCVEMA